MTEFGQKLRELRLRRKWTQSQLAYRAGLKKVTVRFFEAGRRFPKPATLHRLMRALEVNTADALKLRGLYLEQKMPHSSMMYVRYTPEGKEMHDK